MKTITPQPIWIDGMSKPATVIYSQVNSDNMTNEAEFYFQLYVYNNYFNAIYSYNSIVCDL